MRLAFAAAAALILTACTAAVNVKGPSSGATNAPTAPTASVKLAASPSPTAKPSTAASTAPATTAEGVRLMLDGKLAPLKAFQAQNAQGAYLGIGLSLDGAPYKNGELSFTATAGKLKEGFTKTDLTSAIFKLNIDGPELESPDIVLESKDKAALLTNLTLTSTTGHLIGTLPETELVDASGAHKVKASIEFNVPFPQP